MSTTAGSTLTRGATELDPEQLTLGQRPYQVVVWNDPVNLMSYVSWVFRTYFGHTKARAEKLMMQVHTEGRAAVSSGPREQAEQHVSAMHSYGLQATVEQAE